MAATAEEALAGPGMFDCQKLRARISERQCLVNQERAQAGGFPSFCVDCPEGREIKARHPEGPEAVVKRFPELPFQPPDRKERKIMTGNMTSPPPPPIQAKPQKEAPRCPEHPDQPQIALGGKRAGQYMGVCKVCMKERGKTRHLSHRNATGPKPAQNIPENISENIPEAPAPAKGPEFWLDKFPDFDASWGPEVQIKWFEGFQKILDLVRGGAARRISESRIEPGETEVGRSRNDPPRVEASDAGQSGAPSLNKPKNRKKPLPAWLKNATPEVRRDYGF